MTDTRAASALLLIDGYNLLHETPWLGRGRGAAWLGRARDALLSELIRGLPELVRRRTTIVFDAPKAGGRGGPSVADRESLEVRFANGYDDADALLVELIQNCTAPRRLTVVSGDHQVAITARRRGAFAISSAAWYRAFGDGQVALAVPGMLSIDEPVEQSRSEPLTADETRRWLDWLGHPHERPGSPDDRP
jgi:predicted RNA-binding protein with PIN domain